MTNLDKHIRRIAGFSSPVKKKTVTLTDAQIKTWHNTPVEVIPAQGQNKAVIPIYFFASSKFIDQYNNISSNGYITLDTSEGVFGDVALNLASASITQLYGLLFEESCTFGVPQKVIYNAATQEITPIAVSTSNFNNKAVRVTFNNAGAGALTGGNAANTFKITVYYTIIDL